MNKCKEIFDVHNSNTTTSKTLSELKKMKNNRSPDTNMASMTSSSQPNIAESHNSICQNVKQLNNQQQQQQQQQLQYLTNNAIDNCFANDGTSTIVNIDIFDDQLSTSSNSNTSRFSCEAAPLSTTTPPISLNGVIDTNLMHFSPNATVPLNTERLHCGCRRLSGDVTTSDHKCDGLAAVVDNDNCDDDNSSNGSAGSL